MGINHFIDRKWLRWLFDRKCEMHDTPKHSTQIVKTRMTDMVYADLCSPLVILYILNLLGGCKYNMTLYWLMIETSPIYAVYPSEWKLSLQVYLLLISIVFLKWAHKTETRQERWHKQRSKNYRRFIRAFKCYLFNSILNYRKIGKILPKCILFLLNMILNRAMRPISYDNRQILLCF